MTIERIKGLIAYTCDLPGCHEGLETTTKDFDTARSEAFSEGWVTKKRDGQWMNFCCEAHEDMQFRGQKLVKS